MTLIELKTKIRKLLGNITVTEYSDADILTAINDYYLRAINIAIGSSNKWEVNGDIATTNLITNQKEYSLTTDIPLQAISRIEVNVTGASGGWQTAKIIDVQTYEGIISDPTLNTSAISGPCVYFLDNSIFFVENIITNVTGGLKIFYNKSAVELTNGGITTITVNDDGANYVINDVLTVGGTGTGGTVTVTNVDGTGQITAIEVTTVGSGYAVATAVACSGGTGTGAKINITSIDGIEPLLLEEAQIYIVNGACLDYAKSFELSNKINIFKTELVESERRIRDMYSNRLKAVQPRLTIKQIICE